MEIKKIVKLTHNWHSATGKVIDFKNPGLDKIKQLFKETYELIERYNAEELVPKAMAGMLLEMHEFAWWVSDLDETPLHYLYQDIVSLTFELRKYFLTRDASVELIKRIINEQLDRSICHEHS